MSSTRRAKDQSVFHQSRYASNPEFERGLLANLVAKRCALIDDPNVRELIWFVQHISHTAGLTGFVRDIIARYPDRIQTRDMAELELRTGKNCNSETVRKILRDFDWDTAATLPLKGDVSVADFLESISDRPNHRTNDFPESYPAKVLFEACFHKAENSLEKDLNELCLNPESSFESGPWYFPRLIETLFELKAEFVKSKSMGVVITTLGKKVCDVLDYTAYAKALTLVQGEARRGKSFSARAWCDQHPGRARFVEVPTGNDEIGFFRALARGIGLGNFLNYKVTQIRERVESVLLGGDILIVLDEAQRLWPQRNLRYGFPTRIAWVMTMANAGVPIAMIATPQFLTIQKAVEKGGWNSAQLLGRIGLYEELPAELSKGELVMVAKAILPEADQEVLEALAIYARQSDRYLAAIDAISKRARYMAMKGERTEATTEDVRKAMSESIIPADSRLVLAMKGSSGPRRRDPESLAPVGSQENIGGRQKSVDQPRTALQRDVKAKLIAT
jgi:hypothetical protein